MFCPKCGVKNPDDGKFCRKCGTDLNLVSDAIEGKIDVKSGRKKQSRTKSWESAMGKLFMGFAFLAVSIILGLTDAAGGQNWWFWMLIPAFAMIGTGVAQVIQLKEGTVEAVSVDTAASGKEIESDEHAALPPSTTDYVAPDSAPYQTGDLVPPSVVENTTRHLKTDSEGETMTLPDDKVKG